MQEYKIRLTWEAIQDVADIAEYIYKKLFLPSIIFYIVDENLREIHILRILREEQDWAGALVQRQSYTYPENDTEK